MSSKPHPDVLACGIEVGDRVQDRERGRVGMVIGLSKEPGVYVCWAGSNTWRPSKRNWKHLDELRLL